MPFERLYFVYPMTLPPDRERHDPQQLQPIMTRHNPLNTRCTPVSRTRIDINPPGGVTARPELGAYRARTPVEHRSPPDVIGRDKIGS